MFLNFQQTSIFYLDSTKVPKDYKKKTELKPYVWLDLPEPFVCAVVVIDLTGFAQILVRLLEVT